LSYDNKDEDNENRNVLVWKYRNIRINMSLDNVGVNFYIFKTGDIEGACFKRQYLLFSIPNISLLKNINTKIVELRHVRINVVIIIV
jgi:hypothetical protein